MTGRTHQIRVHLSHLGHPIVGDDMYDGKPFIDADGTALITQQALHAALLSFKHPMSDEPMEFVAPVRDEMGDLIKHLQTQGQTESVAIENTIEMSRFGL